MAVKVLALNRIMQLDILQWNERESDTHRVCCYRIMVIIKCAEWHAPSVLAMNIIIYELISDYSADVILERRLAPHDDYHQILSSIIQTARAQTMARILWPLNSNYTFSSMTTLSRHVATFQLARSSIKITAMKKSRVSVLQFMVWLICL